MLLTSEAKREAFRGRNRGATAIGCKASVATTFVLTILILNQALPPAFAYQMYINAGGFQFTDGRGIEWLPDQYFTGGTVQEFSRLELDTEENLARRPMYTTVRQSKTFSYRLPVPAPGNYDLTFFFIEPYFTLGDARKFNVLVDGVTKLSMLDIWQRAGKGKPLVVTVTVTIPPGMAETMVMLTAKMGGRDQACLAGLALTSGGGVNTPPMSISPPPLAVMLPPIPVTPTAPNILPPIVSGTPLAPPVSLPSGGVTPPSTDGLPSPQSPRPQDPSLRGPFKVFVSCGGLGFKDRSNNTWLDDAYFIGGKVKKNAGPVANSGDSTLQALFFKRRIGTDFSYVIPVPRPGTFSVTVYCAEVHYARAGGRIFNILLQGQVVEDKLDIFSKVGKNAALVRTYPVVVTPGQKSITVRFVSRPTGKDQAVVSGLAIAEGPPSPSPPPGAPPPPNPQVYTFDVAYITASPDCVSKVIAGVNGLYPGPAITASPNQVITVVVNNGLKEDLAIHWHGIHHRGRYVWHDGNAWGSQCPIPPGGTYTYSFTTGNQVGTFWWHAHIGFLRSSLYGALNILPNQAEPFPQPYGDLTLLINDWYWRTDKQLEEGLDQINGPYIPLGVPDVLLINGKSRTLCGDYRQKCANRGGCQLCDNMNKQCNPLNAFTVEPGKVYRFRLVNVGLYGSINMQFANHSMTVVEVDGNYVKPVAYKSLDVLPGETYSVLITMNQPVNNYWISANGRFDSFGTSPGIAVLRYKGAPPTDPSGPVPKSPVSEGDASFSPTQQKSYLSYTADNIQNLAVTRRVSLRWGQHQTNGKLRYSVNNVSFVNPGTPLLFADWSKMNNVFNLGLISDTMPKLPAGASSPCKMGTSVIDLPLNSVVQVILQNNSPPGLQHPWHLHGYDFWVVGTGTGQYDPAQEASYKFNLVDPPRRNNVNIYDNNWAAIRFVANNPGMWHFHCHLEPHMHLGMQLFFRVYDKALPGPPDNYLRTCGVFTPPALSPPPLVKPSPPPSLIPGARSYDWSNLGQTTYFNITPGESVTFIFGQTDQVYHSIMPLDPALGFPIPGSSLAATTAYLLALPSQDGIAMTEDQKEAPYLQPPGFVKTLTFPTVGVFAFTCSLHLGSMIAIVSVARPAPPPPPSQPSPPPPNSPPPIQVPTGGACPAAPAGPRPKPSVTMAQYSMNRNGWQSQEYSLTVQRVKSIKRGGLGLFGRINSRDLDGQAYAQPLFLPDVDVPLQGKLDLVFVATQKNYVYALNADPARFTDPGGVWTKNLGKPVPRPRTCGDVDPYIGITSTPVIDPVSKTLYTVTKLDEGGIQTFRLHALDAATGNPRFGSPSAPFEADTGFAKFNATTQHQRSALSLYEGFIYVIFASHCDQNSYSGWIIGLDAVTLQLTKMFATTRGPKGEGAIWMSGGGAAISNGYLYAASGNGEFDNKENFAQTILKLDVRNTDGKLMRLVDWFTPTYPSTKTYIGDTDLGSGGVILMQDQTVGEFLAQMGKSQIVYNLRTSNMGKWCGDEVACGGEDGHAWQHIFLPGNAAVSTVAYWPRFPGQESYLYAHNGSPDDGTGKGLQQFQMVQGRLVGPTKAGYNTKLFTNFGSTPVISSDGCRDGIVWEIGIGSGNSAALVAYDALTLDLIFSSEDMPNNADRSGARVKYSMPLVANGKVYVTLSKNNIFGKLGQASEGGIVQYGLKQMGDA